MSPFRTKQSDITPEVKTASWSNDAAIISDIRRTVFIDEQGVSPEEEWDNLDQDDSCKHLLAYVTSKPENKPEYLGTARILSNGQIGRVCILKSYRNQGIGKLLVQAAMLLGFNNNQNPLKNTLFLYAQVTSLHFYERLGFESEGEIFLDAGIEHKKMCFQNTLPHRTKLFSEYYSDRVHRLTIPNDFCLHLILQTSITRRDVSILCKELRPDMYNNPVFIENLSVIARANRHSKIRILIQSPIAKLSPYHGLITLAKRLPSRIEIKKVDHSVELNGEAYAIFDDTSLVYFNDEDSLVGFANYNARPESKRLLESYNYLWDKRSKPDPDLRVLSL